MGDKTRHCDPRIKSEGKQSRKTRGALRPLDCFVAALLAMTTAVASYASAVSARGSPHKGFRCRLDR
jgi:hypothetical protein